MLMSTEYVLFSQSFMVGMEHCSCQMSFFQGCIDEVRPWVKVIGICVNVIQIRAPFTEFYGR